MFFSVKHAIKIGSKIYIPCICYTVTKELALTVERLKREGKVEVYTEEVFFQNGKRLIKSEQKAEEKKTEEKKVEEKKVEEKKTEEKKGF